MGKQTDLIDYANRRQRMHDLLVWLKDDEDSQARLARAIGVSQSLISDHMTLKPEAACPDDGNKMLFVQYLKYRAKHGKACTRWDLAEFTRYLDSDLTPDVFTSTIRDKPVHSRMPVDQVYRSLTKRELLELFDMFVTEEKSRLVAA